MAVATDDKLVTVGGLATFKAKMEETGGAGVSHIDIEIEDSTGVTATTMYTVTTTSGLLNLWVE